MSLGALGALSIAFRDFALVWQAVPKDIPWHGALVDISGAILLAGSIGLLVPGTTRLSALVLTGFLLLCVLLLRLPGVVAHPLVEGSWYGLGETFTFVAGGWTIFSMSPVRGREIFANLGSVRLGQILFAFALPALGLAHFFYLKQTAPLIPSWLPFHVPLAYFTGAAHIAAGAAILFEILSRLAATLEAVMVSLFTLLVWVPTVAATPANRFDWTELFVSMAIAGTAFTVAESLRGRAWASGRRV